MAGAVSEKTSELLERLEELFCSPDFTTALGEFMGIHLKDIKLVDLQEEQPLQNHDIFGKYTTLVEKSLEAFMAEERMTPQEVYKALEEAKGSGNFAWMTCIDYLLASVDYETFMQLAYDHSMMVTFDPTDESTAWEAPPEDGADPTMVPLDGDENAE